MLTSVEPCLIDQAPDLAQEVDQLRATLAAMRGRIAELEHLADTDSLTPLPNRRAFMRELSRAIQNKTRHEISSAVLYIDLNGLKAVNDTYGHSAGDAMILHVGRELRERVRLNDTVARIGGDEFAIILTHSDQAAADAKAATLVSEIGGTSLDLGRAILPVGIGCGVSMVEADDRMEAVLTRADTAMYASRRSL